MPGPTYYLPLATSELAGPFNPFPTPSLKRRVLGLKGLIALCILVFVTTSFWLLQSATWNWLDGLDSSRLQNGDWLSFLGIHIDHINPASNVYATHIQLRVGPLQVLYRGRFRRIGMWRSQDRETQKHEKVQGMDLLPSVTSRGYPNDANGPRLLIGVFTTAEKAHRRAMIRELQGFQQYCTPQYGIECKFVIGHFDDAGLHEELSIEMEEHSDIILLEHGEQDLSQLSTSVDSYLRRRKHE